MEQTINTTITAKVKGAIEQAIAKASESLHNLDWFEVTETRGHITDSKVAHYQVKVNIGFRLD